MRQAAIIIALAVAAMATPELAQTSVDGTQWKKCGREHARGRAGQCHCVGRVKYGARGRFSYRNSRGWKSCNNRTFGDPIRGTVKDCFCQSHIAHAARRNRNSGRATAWKCYRGFGAPMRRAASGEIECMSHNHKDCLWGGRCDLRRKRDNGRNLACGVHHSRKWGGTGYGNVRHWCSKLNKIIPSKT